MRQTALRLPLLRWVLTALIYWKYAGLEGYMVTADNLAIDTNGFDRYVENA